MNPMTRDEILEKLLALPRPDRAEIAEELLASLDGEPDPRHAEEWLAELRRRLADTDANTELLDWSEVRARVEARLRDGS